MTKTQARIWFVGTGLLSGALLVYVVTTVSPYLSNTSINYPALILLMIGIFFFVSSWGALIASRLHRRWPELAGFTPNSSLIAAVRQGVLAAIVALVMALLALMQMLDLIFVLVTIALAVLLEVFLQNQ